VTCFWDTVTVNAIALTLLSAIMEINYLLIVKCTWIRRTVRRLHSQTVQGFSVASSGSVPWQQCISAVPGGFYHTDPHYPAEINQQPLICQQVVLFVLFYYTGCAKKWPNLFLSKLCQISTKFDNFWSRDSQDDRNMRFVQIVTLHGDYQYQIAHFFIINLTECHVM